MEQEYGKEKRVEQKTKRRVEGGLMKNGRKNGKEI